MIWKILLTTVLLISCQAPKLPRKPRIYLPDSQFSALIRLYSEGDICEGEVVNLDGDLVCIVPLQDTERSFSCLPNQDAQMIFDYINTLIYRCKRWKRR